GRGTPVRLLVRDVTVVDGVASLPAGTELRYHEGEVLVLFDAHATAFPELRMPRNVSWPSVIAFALVPIALVALYARDPAWHAAALFGVIALVADQTIGRGVLSWGVCTR